MIISEVQLKTLKKIPLFKTLVLDHEPERACGGKIIKVMNEINDYYETKNKIGDLIIEHHYGFNKENKTNSEKVKELYFKVFAELDKYREKHGKKE